MPLNWMIFQYMEKLGKMWESNENEMKLIKRHLTGIARICIIIKNVVFRTFNC